MAKEKTTGKSKTVKKPEFKVPALAVWFYALASLAFLPIFYYKPAVDVTLLPKLMVLAILLLVFILMFLGFNKFRIPQMSLLKQSPVLLWAGFVIVSVLSLTVAINPQEGLFDIMKVTLSLFFLILTAGLLIRSGKINPFLVSAILMTIVLSLVGLSQYFTHAFRQTELNALYKINGLWSHKNVLSGILYMALPLLCYSLLTARMPQRILTGMAMFLSINLLILVQTRSIWIGLIAFILVSAFLGYLFRGIMAKIKTPELKKNLIAIVVIVIVAFTTASLIINYSVRNPLYTHMVREVQIPHELKQAHETDQEQSAGGEAETDQPQDTEETGEAYQERGVERIEQVGKRLASVFETSSPNRVKRLEIWSRTIEMFLDHPLLGVGAGNWKIHAPDYYQPDPTEYYYHNWRRPHNDFLWVLSEKGLPGFLFFIGFFISLLVLALKALSRSIPAANKLLVIFMIAGVAGYCVDALFAFPYERVDLQVFLMFYASVILWAFHSSADRKSPEQKKHRRLLLAGMAIILLFSVNALHKMIRAEVYTKHAHNAHVQGQWEIVVRAVDIGYNRRASLDPTNNPMYWYRGNANMRLQRYREAKEDLELALRHNPFSVPVLIDLATVEYMMENYEKAAEIFEEALRIYPMNRGGLRGLGMTYVMLGRYEEAIPLYYKSMTTEHEPTLEALINDAYQKMSE